MQTSQTNKSIAIIALICLIILSGCTDKITGNHVSLPEETKIGFVAPLTSGLSSIVGPAMDAGKLAEKEYNQGIGSNGRKIQLVIEDDHCDPKISLSAIEKLITQDKVPAIVGPICSPSMLGDARLVEESKVVMLSSLATHPGITKSGDYIFRNVPSDANQGKEGARFISKMGAKKVAVMYINNDWGAGMKAVFEEESKRIGLEITGIETFAPSSNDFRTQLTKIAADDPDFIYMLAFPVESGLIIRQAREIGIKSRFVGADGSKDDSIIKDAKGQAEGFIVTLPAIPDSPELKAFSDSYRTRFGREPPTYAPETYDAVKIIMNACASTDCRGESIKEFLYKMGPYHGASGTFEFDSDGEVHKSYNLFEVKGGKWEMKEN